MDDGTAQNELLALSRKALSEDAEVSREEYRAAFRLAFRALQEAAGEIARLKAGLDRYEGREVKYGMERYLQSAISDGSMPGCAVGTIARATDTGAEWELKDTGWQVRVKDR
jgi:hypothetical protein